VDYYVKNPKNISTFSRISAGRYSISFTTGYGDEDYVITAMARGRSANNLVVNQDFSGSLSQSTFYLAVTNAATAAATDADRVMFVVA
jgi:hypothetical protein